MEGAQPGPRYAPAHGFPAARSPCRTSARWYRGARPAHAGVKRRKVRFHQPWKQRACGWSLHTRGVLPPRGDSHRDTPLPSFIRAASCDLGSVAICSYHRLVCSTNSSIARSRAVATGAYRPVTLGGGQALPQGRSGRIQLAYLATLRNPRQQRPQIRFGLVESAPIAHHRNRPHDVPVLQLAQRSGDIGTGQCSGQRRFPRPSAPAPMRRAARGSG